MQKASKYPKTAEHKQVHDAFASALADLKAEFAASDDKMLMKITKIALNWLDSHIKGADRDFGDYFKASGLVLAPIRRDASEEAL